jgi:hypothetical protein
MKEGKDIEKRYWDMFGGIPVCGIVRGEGQGRVFLEIETNVMVVEI